MHKLSPAIRKAAILVSSLDQRAADALLAQMGDETAARVRSALVELDDIPAEEQRAVLAEFFAGRQSAADRFGPADPGLEVELSTVAESDAANDARFEPATDDPQQPFSFLQQFPSEAIASVLSREAAQTIAVVIAQLLPSLAARILEAMPAGLASEALERMASLGQPSDAALADIADLLRRELSCVTVPEKTPKSLSALQSLLGAMNQATRQHMLSGLNCRNGRLAQQLGYQADRIDANQLQYQVEPTDLALAHERSERGIITAPLVEFEDLLLLSNNALRRLFAAAPSNIVLLALTGAPEAVVSRIVGELPSAEAATLRKRLAFPGPVRLSDIAAAQEELAAIARKLAEAGAIALPGMRRFAAAA